MHRVSFLQRSRAVNQLRTATLTLLLAAIFCLPASAQNIIENGKFDADLTGWVVGESEWEWQAEDSRTQEASGSVRVTNSDEEASKQLAFRSQCVAVQPNTTYSVFADLLLETGASAGDISASILVSAGADCFFPYSQNVEIGKIESTSTTGQWTVFEKTITTGSDDGSVLVTVDLAKDDLAGEVSGAADNLLVCEEGSCAPDEFPDTSDCVDSDTTACLLNGRFEVNIQWTTKDSNTGPGQVMSFGAERAETDQSAFFYFFQPANFEMGVKMVDACTDPFNHYWVFVSGLTNVAYNATVRDTATGRIRTYSNPQETYPTTRGDTKAFSCD